MNGAFRNELKATQWHAIHSTLSMRRDPFFDTAAAVTGRECSLEQHSESHVSGAVHLQILMHTCLHCTHVHGSRLSKSDNRNHLQSSLPTDQRITNDGLANMDLSPEHFASSSWNAESGPLACRSGLWLHRHMFHYHIMPHRDAVSRQV